MSRQRPAAGASMSLFPFLAVLLCTMGALLVLLVLFSHRARDAETAEALAAEAARADEFALARDELVWRLEQLRGVRDRTAADLARARMLLAGAEDDSRTLADELEVLERTAAALLAEAEAPSADALDDVERRLAEARRDADQARTERKGKPPAYAVVPYEGDAGTHRRPLYIECCIDGVFLQPEGIRLGPSDFEGPPGPGNPLASALRAAREHIASRPGESGAPDAQPYPLMLVRPSGVMAYYSAREAIQSWGSEFGYQFVDEDWEIAYPPADAALADAERRAIEEARRRLAWLAQVRPPKPQRSVTHYRAATTRGGVVADGGPSVLGDQSRFDWTDEQAAGGRGRDGAGGLGAGGSGEAAGGGTGTTAGADGLPGGGPLPGGGAPGRFAGPSTFYAGAGGGSDAGGAGAAEAGFGGPNTNGIEGPGHRGGTATDGAGSNTAAAAGPAGATAAGSAAGGIAAAPGGAGAAGGASDGADGGTSGGQAGAAGGQAGGQAGGAQSGSAGGGQAGPSLPGLAQGGAEGGAGAATSVSVGGAGAAGSLAGARGSNWASLATHDRPVPLTRPIRVECAAHEFRLLDEGTGRVAVRVPIGSDTAEAVDPLVKAVHDRVARWGIAGDRMFWKPELVLSETHDGHGRREDLERLLADSGLDTRRSGDDAVRQLPPVRGVGAVPAVNR